MSGSRVHIERGEGTRALTTAPGPASDGKPLKSVQMQMCAGWFCKRASDMNSECGSFLRSSDPDISLLASPMF